MTCEGGTAQFEYHNCRWRWMTQPESEWSNVPFGPLERDELFVRQAQSFLDAVARKQPPLCSLGEAIQTLRVTLGILESSRDRRWVSVPQGGVTDA